MATQPLSDYVGQQRARALCVSNQPANVGVHDSPHRYPRSGAKLNLENFTKDLVKINRLSKRSIEFDLIGVDVSVANALRRIMIGEVPSLAIEHVYVMNNTSVIQDEALAQRFGLVLTKASPTSFDYRADDSESPTHENTAVFKLQRKCERNPEAADEEMNSYELYINSHGWEPKGNQSKCFANDPIRHVHANIFIAKLRLDKKSTWNYISPKRGKDLAK